ncbi:hypothetical protein B9Z51_14255 [Limnohabitans sp. T6-5]|nr:hypothetical protein B9Z51_14255 [Limnohabitans sp. T6-5]
MGIALLAFSGLFQGLTAFQRAAPASITSPTSAKRLRPVWPTRHATCAPSPSQTMTRMNMPNAPASMPSARPLRVMRISESDQRTTGAGRMVISGRMADVCAELDRLAALEALHSHI